jgi:hypothetical protein
MRFHAAPVLYPFRCRATKKTPPTAMPLRLDIRYSNAAPKREISQLPSLAELTAGVPANFGGSRVDLVRHNFSPSD